MKCIFQYWETLYFQDFRGLFVLRLSSKQHLKQRKEHGLTSDSDDSRGLHISVIEDIQYFSLD